MVRWPNWNLRMDVTLLSDVSAWQRLGGADTATEIAQQPALWEALAQDLSRARDRLQAFLGGSLNDPNQRVLFTGAGSSGFIAEMVADAINAQWPAEVRVVHTTSLLTHPALYLQRDRPTLLVSFGRSGSSPESVAAVERVRSDVDDARFLDITCNADGELARRGAGRADTCTLLMPSASCDRAFAMTSSLTCMLLAALTVFDRSPWDARVARLKQIAALAREGQAQWDAPVAALAQRPFNRINYLGSGPLEALARECALKVLELTAGRVLALANTPLGFRHGPKSTLDGNTLVVCCAACSRWRAATNRTCWKSCAATAWPARCWRSARIRTSAPMTNTPSPCRHWMIRGWRQCGWASRSCSRCSARPRWA